MAKGVGEKHASENAGMSQGAGAEGDGVLNPWGVVNGWGPIGDDVQGWRADNEAFHGQLNARHISVSVSALRMSISY